MQRRIAITGAGSGIGRAVARRLSADGAVVALLDRDADAARATAELLDGDHLVVRVDVTDPADVTAAFEEIRGAWGGLDGLVVNAAVQLFGEDAGVLDLDLEVFDRTLSVNLRGAFLTAQAGARMLRDGGRGAIVVTGSPTGLGGGAWGTTAYSVSKAAVHGLARDMAIELAPHGIRVNVVIPGFTATPLVTTIGEDPDAFAELVGTIPLGRQGLPEEAAAVIAFALSADASFMTGSLIVADGGAHAR